MAVAARFPLTCALTFAAVSASSLLPLNLIVVASWQVRFALPTSFRFSSPLTFAALTLTFTLTLTLTLIGRQRQKHGRWVWDPPFFPQAPKSKEVIDKFWAYSTAKGWSEGQHTHPLSRPNSNTNRCHLRGISPASQEQQQLTLDAYYTALEEYKTAQAQ